MLASSVTAVPGGPRGTRSLTCAPSSGGRGWVVSFGALAGGFAVAALLLALVVMHAGLAPAMGGHSTMTAGGGGTSAVAVPGHFPAAEAVSATNLAMARPADGNPS